jgi:hypothetical protein
MTWAGAFENRLHEKLRKHCDTPQRVAVLAVLLTSAFLVAIYLPQLLTGEATFGGARDECRDAPCLERFDEAWYTRGSKTSTDLNSGGGGAEKKDFSEAKIMCRRSVFCDALMESPMMVEPGNSGNDAWMFVEARDVCRDAYCVQNTVSQSEKISATFLGVTKTLAEIFSSEMEAMRIDLDEGLAGGRDKDGKLAVGLHSYPMLKIIEEQLSDSSVSLVHWHALEVVSRIANETEWTKRQLDRLNAQADRWEAVKLEGDSSSRAVARLEIVAIILEELRLPPSTMCSYSCFLSGDGICDDGGPGAESYACDFGTDCQVGNL